MLLWKLLKTVWDNFNAWCDRMDREHEDHKNRTGRDY